MTLREDLNDDVNTAERRLVVAVDGGYTNRELFRTIPSGTTLVGRIRKDAQLHGRPDGPATPGKGRPRFYGASLQTPEQLRQDETIPWIEVEVFAAGKIHKFEVKVAKNIRWKPAGPQDM